MLSVSAIMPTRGRREWAMKAVHCFLNQTYPNKQLLILDDLDDRSFPKGSADLPPSGSFVYPNPEIKRPNIGCKRNKLNGLAGGDIIMHFDSDDWSDPGRMAHQVQQLESSGMAVTGSSSIYFIAEERRQAWKYTYPMKRPLGTTLAYWREYWLRNPFPDCQVGEDNSFAQKAIGANQIYLEDAASLFVARVHSGNSSVKRPTGAAWKSVPLTAIPAGFFKEDSNGI